MVRCHTKRSVAEVVQLIDRDISVLDKVHDAVNVVLGGTLVDALHPARKYSLLSLGKLNIIDVLDPVLGGEAEAGLVLGFNFEEISQGFVCSIQLRDMIHIFGLEVLPSPSTDRRPVGLWASQ